MNALVGSLEELTELLSGQLVDAQSHAASLGTGTNLGRSNAGNGWSVSSNVTVPTCSRSSSSAWEISVRFCIRAWALGCGVARKRTSRSLAPVYCADIDDRITREEAEEQLTLVLESVVENYGEYRDYNSTTTQSDRGELLYTLLDFLRLRTEYDRICWHLKPVVLAHEILVRRNQDGAARLWRRALTDRIDQEADQYLQRLAELQKKYAIRMPTIADRLAERFVRPMAIDRIRALRSTGDGGSQSARPETGVRVVGARNGSTDARIDRGRLRHTNLVACLGRRG